MSVTHGRRELIARLHHVLVTAQQERPRRPALTTWEDGPLELGWITFERAVMHAEINRLRAEAGLPPAPLNAVASAEDQTVGNADYTGKFALYCTELTLDENHSA